MKEPIFTASRSCRLAGVALAGLALLLTAGSAAAKEPAGNATTSTNAPAVERPIPVSLFDSSANTGRNPFFPRSKREASKTTDAVVSSRFPDDVKLKGISVSQSRRLAIINTRTIAAGEASEVTGANGRRISVRVISVNDNSAVVTADGMTEELTLQK